MSSTTLPKDRVKSANRPSASRVATIETISLDDRLDGSNDFIARIDVLRQQARDELTLSDVDSSEQPRTLGFCATLFVFGQIVSLWALANGHMAPMVIGLLFSLTGAGFGLGSIMNRHPNIETAETALLSDKGDGSTSSEAHRNIV